MNMPTEKQIKYAEKISRYVGVELPKEFSAKAYWNFINENQNDYNAKMCQMQIDMFADEDDIFWGYDYGLWEY